MAFSIFDSIGSFFGVSDANAAGTIPQAGNATPALKAAINANPSPVKTFTELAFAGGVALESEAGPSGTAADIDGTVATDQISIYVVRPGDSISAIAKMYDVTVNTIIWANDLNSKGTIQPGQTLVILPVTGLRHTVVKGETLASIVKKYKGDMADVLAFNGLSEGAKVAVGDTLLIPDGVEPTVVSSPSSSGSATVRSAGGPAISGYFARPVAGVRTQGLHGYNGVDIGAPTGTSVFASAGGNVIIARATGYNGGYGGYVVIQHGNGTQTLYAHLSRVHVVAGTTVAQGQLIGAVGATGKATGPHLHFEIRGAANPF